MTTLPQHIVYTYNPPALGFRLFGKPVTWRNILRGAAKKLLDMVGAAVDNATGGVFHNLIEEGKQKVNNYLATALAPKTLTQKTSAATATLEDTEETFLAHWADTYLKPFLQKLTNLLAVCEQDVALQVKADALSKVTWYMDAIQDHFNKFDFGVLTENGLAKRDTLLQVVLEPIDAVVKAYVEDFGLNTVPYNFNPAGTDFKPLLNNGTPLTNVATEKYTVPAGSATPTASTPVNTLPAPTPMPVATTTTPTKVPVVKSGTNNAANVLVPKNTAPEQVLQQITKMPTVTPISGKGSTTTAWVVGGAIATGLVIYAIAKRKNKGMNGPKKSKK